VMLSDVASIGSFGHHSDLEHAGASICITSFNSSTIRVANASASVEATYATFRRIETAVLANFSSGANLSQIESNQRMPL
jgi:hypothetical protein